MGREAAELRISGTVTRNLGRMASGTLAKTLPFDSITTKSGVRIVSESHARAISREDSVSVMRRPGLLVSVRNGQEASIAERAGADLLDSKEPANGPLGRCDESVWIDVARRTGGRMPLSAALGEWHEWADLDDAAVSRRLSCLEGYRFAKLGPGASKADGGEGLERTFLRLMDLGPPGLRWIAVVYADGQGWESLDRNSILSMARRAGCAGLLIDTCDKSRPMFWDEGWRRFVSRVRGANLLVALAGGLTAKSMRRLAAWEPDWFAVRGAACGDGVRESAVSFRRVQELDRGIEKFGPGNRIAENRP